MFATYDTEQKSYLPPKLPTLLIKIKYAFEIIENRYFYTKESKLKSNKCIKRIIENNKLLKLNNIISIHFS